MGSRYAPGERGSPVLGRRFGHCDASRSLHRRILQRESNALAAFGFVAAMSDDPCYGSEAGGRIVRPVLVVNPRTDSSFVAFVREQIEGLAELDPLSFECRLRERHPAATVRARALASEPTTVWYVYRDGHWTPST